MIDKKSSGTARPSRERGWRPGFWRLARGERPAIVRAGLFAAAGAATKVAQAVIVLALLREGQAVAAGGGEVTGLWLLVLALATVTLAGELFTRQASTGAHHADIRFTRGLRARQITHLQRMPLDWFTRNGSGRVKKFVQDDVFRVHEMVAHIVPDLTASVLTPVLSLVLLFWWDPRLGLIALLPLALTVLALPLVLRGRSPRADDYDRRLGDLNTAVVEFVRGIEPVKVFGATREGRARFRAASVALATAYQDWVRATLTGSALLSAFTSPAFAVATMAAGGTVGVLTSGLDPVLVAPALLLSAGIAAPLSIAVAMVQKFREADQAAGSLEAFFALPAQDPADATARVGSPEVGIEGVGFRYPDGPRALDGVSAELPAGSLTALVGPSGSGKSTFAALLPRLIDPDEGTVRIGGADIRGADAASLYSTVSFVFQQPYLFRMSVRDNIALTRPEATRAEVEDAARAAQIHDAILGLPGGYDCVLGVDADLSGGQQQRLSIARALLTAPSILVLDEATAYADPDSEAAVQRALSALMTGRTILAIAHRLHTITDADRILVLDAGRVIERGTHGELTARGGAYARMWGAYAASREWMSEVRA